MAGFLPHRITYMAMNLFFVLGLVLTVIGMGVVQNRCTNDTANYVQSIATFTKFGDGCRKFYQLVWTVIALNLLPVLLVIVATIKPSIARGAATSYFAVVAVLDILMAHAFYSMAETNAINDAGDDVTKGTDEQWYKVVLAGFAILAAMALLMVLADALVAAADHGSKKQRTTTSRSSSHSSGHRHAAPKVERERVDVIVNPDVRREPVAPIAPIAASAAPVATRPAPVGHHHNAMPAATPAVVGGTPHGQRTVGSTMPATGAGNPDRIVGYIVEDPNTHEQRRI